MSYLREGAFGVHLVQRVLPGTSERDALRNRAIAPNWPASRGPDRRKARVPAGRVSHNLACLLNCGFVLSEWQGKNKVYRLNPDMDEILTGIEEHLAQYAPALDSCGVLKAESKPIVIVRTTPSQLPGSQRRISKSNKR